MVVAGSNVTVNGNMTVANVGIGSNFTPDFRLDVPTPTSAVNFQLMDFRSTSGYGIYAQSDAISNRGNTIRFMSTDYNTNTVTTRDVLSLRPEGMVGIGTQTPSYTLDVNGTVQLQNDMIVLANAGAWDSTAGKGMYIRYSTNGTQDAGYIQSITRSTGIYQNMKILASNIYIGGGEGTEKLAVLANGNVGIGNLSPSFLLDVTGVTRCTKGIVVNSVASTPSFTGNQFYSFVRAPTGSNSFYGGDVFSDTGFALGIDTSDKDSVSRSKLKIAFGSGAGTFNTSLTRMTFDNSGNVGIGTTSPSSLLHVQSQRAAIGSTTDTTPYIRVIKTGMSNYDTASILLGQGTGDYNTGTLQYVTGTGNIYSYMTLGLDSTQTGLLMSYNGNSNSASTGINGKSYVNISTNNVERMRFDSSGRVGIGTTSPSWTLDVAGTINSSTQLRFPSVDAGARVVIWDNGAGGYAGLGKEGSCTVYSCPATTDYHKFVAYSSGTQNELMRLTGDGKLGIATTNPQAALQVRGDLRLHPDFGSGKWLRAQADNDVEVTTFERVVNNTRINTLSNLLLNPNGNVGIGTATPSYKLEVNGSVYHVDITTLMKGSDGTGYTHFPNTDGKNYIRGTTIIADNGGNVGIGLTAPTSKLHVSGNVYATGTVTWGSDRRYKENIKPITDALSIVSQLNGYRYTRVDESTSNVHIGVIAQEVEPILPEVVQYDAQHDKYAVSYGNITAVLIEAIKELQLEVVQLKQKLGMT
jgi:hypothetical protein